MREEQIFLVSGADGMPRLGSEAFQGWQPASRNTSPFGGVADKVRGLKNIFGMYPVASSFMKLPLDFAKSKGLTRVAVVYAGQAFGTSVKAGAKRSAEKNGMQIVAEVPYPKSETDFSTVVKNVKAANPDVLIGGTCMPDSEGIILEAKKQGLSPKIIVMTVGPPMPGFGKDLGSDADGVMGISPWDAALTYLGSQEFVKRFKKAYGRSPGHTAGGGFGTGQVLEAALKKAGSLDKDKLRQALRELKITTVFGPYAVDGTGKQTAKTPYTSQWIGGQRYLVMPEEVANHEILYPFRPWDTRQSASR